MPEFCFTGIPKGMALNRPQICGDVLANHPVPACCALHENPVSVMQDDRQPVNFRLNGEAVCVMRAIQFADALVPRIEFFLAKRVCQRKNRRGMPHLAELSAGGAPAR